MHRRNCGGGGDGSCGTATARLAHCIWGLFSTPIPTTPFPEHRGAQRAPDRRHQPWEAWLHFVNSSVHPPASVSLLSEACQARPLASPLSAASLRRPSPTPSPPPSPRGSLGQVCCLQWRDTNVFVIRLFSNRLGSCEPYQLWLIAKRRGEEVSRACRLQTGRLWGKQEKAIN